MLKTKRKNLNKNFDRAEMRYIFKNEGNPKNETKCDLFDRNENFILIENNFIKVKSNLKKSNLKNETFIITNGIDEQINYKQNLNETNNALLIKEKKKKKVYLQENLYIEKTAINFDAMKKIETLGKKN